MIRVFKTSLLLALLLCFTLPAEGLAKMTVKVTNKTSRKISLAMNYKDEVSDEWVTRGWWSVEPLSKSDITLNTNNSIAYFYGSAGKAWWGGKKGKDGAIVKTVVGDKFLVKDKNKPTGKNQRAVVFKKMSAENRVFAITLSGD